MTSRAWCRPPMTGATSSWARTEGCSPSATHRSSGRSPGLGVAVHDIRGIVPTRDNRGYFLVGRDGGVFAFGDAPFLGSLPGEGIHISDVTGIAATPSDQGYWVGGCQRDGLRLRECAQPRLGSGIALAGVGNCRDLRRWWLLDRDARTAVRHDSATPVTSCLCRPSA